MNSSKEKNKMSQEDAVKQANIYLEQLAKNKLERNNLVRTSSALHAAKIQLLEVSIEKLTNQISELDVIISGYANPGSPSFMAHRSMKRGHK
jgi:phage shock protein A